MVLFGKRRPEACSRCAKSVSPEDFEVGRAILLLGYVYCGNCQGDLRRACHDCKKPLRQADFDSGRAVTLGSDLYCDGCLEAALHRARPAAVLPPSVVERLSHAGDEAPAPETPSAIPPSSTKAPARPPAPPARAPEGDWQSRRSSARFVPPHDCVLSIRPSGLLGLLGGNSVKLWLDVSEGGLRAVIAGTYAEGDLLRGRFSHPSLKKALDFRIRVRHSKASERFEGCSLVGVKFEHPASELVTFIREVLGAHVDSSTKPSSALSA